MHGLMQRDLEENKSEYKRAEQQREKELAAARDERYWAKLSTWAMFCILFHGSFRSIASPRLIALLPMLCAVHLTTQ